jgi:hypothetical protein
MFKWDYDKKEWIPNPTKKYVFDFQWVSYFRGNLWKGPDSKVWCHSEQFKAVYLL